MRTDTLGSDNQVQSTLIRVPDGKVYAWNAGDSTAYQGKAGDLTDDATAMLRRTRMCWLTKYSWLLPVGRTLTVNRVLPLHLSRTATAVYMAFQRSAVCWRRRRSMTAIR